MVKTRSGADLTKSSCENKRAYNARGETTMSLIPGDSLGETKRFILTKLSDEVGSKLSKSVVSLVLSDADKVLFACSGIAIDNPGWTTRFLAPKSLVRALNDSKEGCGNLKIEVHLEGGEVHIGSLSHFCSDQNFAVVNVMSPLDVHVVLLEQAEEILPHSSLVAVGRDIFGKLITKSVILTEDISRFDDPYGRIFSNHKSDEAWEGGALFDCAGNFVGMNIFLVFEKSFFLPRSLVVMGMRDFWASRPLLKKRRFPYSKHSKAARPKNRPTGAISNCHLEENFGDEYGKGFWMELSKRASTNINRSVVALASFSDHTRLFTCTGFFIEWNGSTPILTSASLVRSSHDENKICENMRIEVLLPNKQRVEGLSYDDLPHHLKTCLLYLSLFPEDYKIERDQVVKKWIAEGFINTKCGQDLEEIGVSYFNDLNRNMIQPVTVEYVYDGQVHLCRVHDMIRDLLISKSIEENFASFFGDTNHKLVMQSKFRRLSVIYYSQEQTMVPTSAIISNCRSLSIFGYSEQMPSLAMFQLLRVLDIENGEEMEKTYFENITRLVHLKYIRLNLRSIAALPEEIGELQNLQTLDLGWTKIKKVPKSIVQLQNLTCLRVKNMEAPEEIGNLHALQELSEIKIDGNSSASSLLGLRSLTKLRILRVHWCVVNTHTNCKDLTCNLLASLRELGRISLRFLYVRSYYGCSIEFLLDSWFPTPHILQKFGMGTKYYFPRIPSWIESLGNLTCLDISLDPLEEKALAILGNLPSLMFLWVTSKSAATKERLVVSRKMFICLKEFHLTCWSNGAGLMFEAGAMRNLEKLQIPFNVGSCLYFGIQHLYSLRHLVVEIICSGATAQEMEALEEAIRSAANLLPNHPILELRTWDEDKMAKEESKTKEEISTRG